MVILTSTIFVLTILIKPILNKDLYPSSIPPKTTFWKIGVFTFWPKNLICGFGQFWNFFQKNLRAFPTPPINMNRFYKAVFKWEKLSFGVFYFDLTVGVTIGKYVFVLFFHQNHIIGKNMFFGSFFVNNPRGYHRKNMFLASFFIKL